MKKSKIETGDAVAVILQNPREKLFGTLQEITSAGIFLRGLDLNYFDAWMQEIADGEPHLPLNEIFIPMWRVEKITLDEGSEILPSLTDKFHNKTGQNFSEF